MSGQPRLAGNRVGRRRRGLFRSALQLDFAQTARTGDGLLFSVSQESEYETCTRPAGPGPKQKGAERRFGNAVFGTWRRGAA